MPEWLHERATHILAKNPSMPKGEAFAIATNQSHALGKTPKGYGTAEGHARAKDIYTTPKDDKKTANPGNLSSPKMEKKSAMDHQLAAFRDELAIIIAANDNEKVAGLFGGGAFDTFISGTAKAAPKAISQVQKTVAPVAKTVAKATMPPSMHGFSDPSVAKAFEALSSQRQRVAPPTTPSFIQGQSLLGGGIPRASQVTGLPAQSSGTMPVATAEQSGVRRRPVVVPPAIQGAA